MAIITMPSNLALAKNGVFWSQRRYDLSTMSDGGGNTQERLGSPPRWALSLTAPQSVTEAEAIVWRQMLLQLRGRVNHLAAWNPAQPAPRGTMRGSMTLNGNASAGATSISITAGGGQANNTILSGSPLQIGSGLTGQLIHTVADATANGSGVISVTIEPPLRIGYAGGTTVTWDKAAAHFKVTSGGLGWRHYGLQIHQDFAIDLLESWT